MRLATFNILHGRSIADGHVRADRLYAAVQTLRPDVLGLQEVDRAQARSHGLDQTAIAADAMGAVAVRFIPAIDGTPGERWRAARAEGPADEPAYGVSLLSRLPVRSWHVARLPTLPVRSPLRTQDKRWVMARDEPRVAVAAVLSSDAGPITVATTHLSFLPGWNVMQLRRLLAEFAGLPRPFILTGDLNIPGPLPRSVAGWRPLAVAPTYPLHEPRVQLDHLLVDGRVGAVSHTAAPALPISDHRALVADVEPTPRDQPDSSASSSSRDRSRSGRLTSPVRT